MRTLLGLIYNTIWLSWLVTNTTTHRWFNTGRRDRSVAGRYRGTVSFHIASFLAPFSTSFSTATQVTELSR